MKNTDVAHLASELELERMEKELISLYNKVSKEVTKELEDKMKAVETWKKDNVKLLEENPELYYKKLENKYLSIEKSTKIISGVANQMSVANVQAMAIINKRNLNVYSLNHNYAFKEVDRQVNFEVNYDIYNKNIVKQLLEENPALFPQGEMDVPADKLWNQKKIQQTILSDVIKGKSIPDIAKDLQSITDMNKNSSIRNARTLVTQTQNKARVDANKEIDDMGILYETIWVATSGGRTRDTHRRLDGEKADEKGYFRIGSDKLRYPGDPRGKPENVYNCRCSLRKKVIGVDKEKVNKYVNKNS